MMHDQLILHGYAAPFGASVLYGDGFLQIHPLAFRDWRKKPDTDCSLIWGSHESDDVIATTADRSLHLFADAHGLWFRAAVGNLFDNLGQRGLITQRKKLLDQISIDFVVRGDGVDTYLGCRRQTITRAAAGHIAIVPRAAFGEQTGVWPANEPLDEAPWRIQQFEAHLQNVCGTWPLHEFNFAARRSDAG
jgi:hypothetical protein